MGSRASKFLFLLLTLVIAPSSIIYAQPNLVPNPGFEEFVNCPYVESDLTIRASLDSSSNAKNWFNTGNLSYYNKCGNLGFYGNWVGVPQNLQGYQDGHFSSIENPSNGYMGLYVMRAVFRPPGKENLLASYLQCKLQAQLISRLRYKGAFFVSPCGLASLVYQSWHLTNNDSSRVFTTSSLGAFFSDAPLSDMDIYKHFVLPAQIKNDPNRDLNDTNNWTEISGVFEANGTELYMAIGNFNDSANTFLFNSYGYPEPWVGKQQLAVPYFFDDVSVIPQNTTHSYDTILCSNTTITLSAIEEADSFEWSDGNKSDRFRQFSNSGWIWVKSWLYGGTVYMLDSFNLIPSGDLNSGLPKDTFLCYGQNQINLFSKNNNPLSSFLWSNGGTSPNQNFSSTEIISNPIWLKISQSNCFQIDTFKIKIQNKIVIPMKDDTSICFDEVPQLLLDAGRDFKGYLWQPTGETSRTIFSTKTETYILTVTDSFNCKESKTIVVDEMCADICFLPNAFTPNGDGLNDTYKPINKAKNIETWELLIYNRWGTEIFKSNTINEGWNGEGAPSGVYLAIFNYTLKNQPKSKSIRTSFNLLR
jgi:gliding motility-associated-like protein